MKHGVYVYYDRVAEQNINALLLIAPNDEAAVRDFCNMMLNEQFPKDKNMDDYDLLRLGSYDLMENKLCELVPYPVSHPVCRGSQVKAMRRELERQRRLDSYGVEAERSEDAAPSASDSAPDPRQLELVNDHA